MLWACEKYLYGGVFISYYSCYLALEYMGYIIIASIANPKKKNRLNGITNANNAKGIVMIIKNMTKKIQNSFSKV